MSTEINFVRNYGFPPAPPYWLVWAAGEDPTKHTSLADAEAHAASLASSYPGRSFDVLGVLCTVATSADIVGTRFDPTREHPRAETMPSPVAVPASQATDQF
jgi:hypothetical protein